MPNLQGCVPGSSSNDGEPFISDGKLGYPRSHL
jgi:hypothetical protein